MEHEDALDAEIGERCRSYPRAELLDRLAAADAMAAPVNELADVATDPQVIHNGMIVTTPHAVLGQLEVTGVPVRFERTPGSVRRGPPLLGEDTREILEELGYAGPAIHSLAASGAVAGAASSDSRG
jgi:crotonobetainyl-CoA:carnitine CoA-transferase CaiB-like acyl-CoA transferase